VIKENLESKLDRDYYERKDENPQTDRYYKFKLILSREIKKKKTWITQGLLMGLSIGKALSRPE
jgi:hypothetical protein